jgi:hypothetical protein
MLLIELANSFFPYKLVSRNNNKTFREYRFSIDQGKNEELTYYVGIYFENDDVIGSDEPGWQPTDLEIMFSTSSTPLIKNATTLDIRRTDKVTGTGNAFKVFSTVLKILKENLEEFSSINKITFGAKSTEQSRVKLYSHFFDNLNKYLPGWKASKATSKKDSIIYVLKKI